MFIVTFQQGLEFILIKTSRPEEVNEFRKTQLVSN